MNLKHLSDDQLLSGAKKWAEEERKVLTHILWHIREVDRRRLYSDLKYASLHDYLVGELKYSNEQAYRRRDAARALAEHPELEEKLNSGALSLTHINMAQNLFSQEKKAGSPYSKSEKTQVFESIANTSTRAAEKILLSKASTKPELKDQMRAVSADITEIKFHADDALLKKINNLKGLLAHSNPNIKMAELIEMLCELGEKEWDLAKHKTKAAAQDSEFAAPKKRQASDVSFANSYSTSSYISAKTRRLIWQKAQSKCENCSSTYRLEIDHRLPRAKNGSSSIENLRLLCRACNQRAAIREFGESKMAKYLNSIQN